jgi:organic hydroperoxide reductase OsmC/OhrA
MSSPFPHRYVSTVTRMDRGRARIEAAPREALSGGPSPELHGDPLMWSPEHLLVSALGLSLFTTFDAFTGRENLNILEWRETVIGMMDKAASGLAFKAFTIRLELTVDKADIERAREVLERAKKYCIITKALHVPVVVEAHIWEHDHRAHA